MNSNVVLFAALFAGIISITTAAVSRGDFNDPANPGKCTIRSDLILSPGEETTDPENCIRIGCQEGGAVLFSSCGTVQPPNGCTFGDFVDRSRAYPSCCERVLTC